MTFQIVPLDVKDAACSMEFRDVDRIAITLSQIQIFGKDIAHWIELPLPFAAGLIISATQEDVT